MSPFLLRRGHGLSDLAAVHGRLVGIALALVVCRHRAFGLLLVRVPPQGLEEPVGGGTCRAGPAPVGRPGPPGTAAPGTAAPRAAGCSPGGPGRAAAGPGPGPGRSPGPCGSRPGPPCADSSAPAPSRGTGTPWP